MKGPVLVGCILALAGGPAIAAAKKGMRLWNLTSETLTEVSLAPAGTRSFGPNQCANDKDGSVEFDEQLTIKGVGAGVYDIRTKDDTGRVCLAKSVAVEADAVFSLRDKDLTDCAR